MTKNWKFDAWFKMFWIRGVIIWFLLIQTHSSVSSVNPLVPWRSIGLQQNASSGSGLGQSSSIDISWKSAGLSKMWNGSVENVIHLPYMRSIGIMIVVFSKSMTLSFLSFERTLSLSCYKQVWNRYLCTRFSKMHVKKTSRRFTRNHFCVHVIPDIPI